MWPATFGLHPKDTVKLIQTLKKMRDLGNTVLVVEHDLDMIRAADWVVDMGPGGGIHGGNILYNGPPKAIHQHPQSLTGQYLYGKRSIGIPKRRRKGNGRHITINGATQNNLKAIDVSFPLGCLIGVTGVSGSGKSSLVIETLYPHLKQRLHQSLAAAGKCGNIEGASCIDRVINIDQTATGRTPRSNPATYTGVFTTIRDLFAKTPDARVKGYRPGRFSFNESITVRKLIGIISAGGGVIYLIFNGFDFDFKINLAFFSMLRDCQIINGTIYKSSKRKRPRRKSGAAF